MLEAKRKRKKTVPPPPPASGAFFDGAILLLYTKSLVKKCQNLYHCWWRGALYCMEEYKGMI
jgi:hypothetical protein